MSDLSSYFFETVDGTRLDCPPNGIIGRLEVRGVYPWAPEAELSNVSKHAVDLEVDPSGDGIFVTRSTGANPFYVGGDKVAKGERVLLRLDGRLTFHGDGERTALPLVLKRKEGHVAGAASGRGRTPAQDETPKHANSEAGSPYSGTANHQERIRLPSIEPELPLRSDDRTDEGHVAAGQGSPRPSAPDRDQGSGNLDAAEEGDDVEGGIEREETTDEERDRDSEGAEEITSESDLLGGRSSDEERLASVLRAARRERRKAREADARIKALKRMPDKAKAKPAKRRAPEPSSLASDDERPSSRAPKTAYGRFAKENRPLFREQNPGLTKEEITRMLREEFRRQQGSDGDGSDA
ncbi:hypothetical protein DFJ74DRAFT_640181 [Hyaloraphidium curvatum]|nr:hypothetical protein DFJ74DRAFT_640181 [Hyaloraphidium curvatum]